MKNNPFPPHIRKVAVIAPAGREGQDSIMAGCSILNAFGIETLIMPHVFAGSSEGYLAAGVDARLADLLQCWCEKDVDLILCSRGGFGSAHLLPYIDWQLLRSRPLPLVGYSDITALHMAMYAKNCGPLIAAPMCARIKDLSHDDYTFYHYARALQENAVPEKLVRPDGTTNLQVLKPGTASASLFAVNLSVAVTLCGTPFMPDLTGHILMLEDVSEPVYRLDRYLTQLSQCGVFGKLGGLMFGTFKECGTAEEREVLFRRIAGEIPGPVVAGFPFGHTFPFVSIRQGRRVTINADGTVVY